MPRAAREISESGRYHIMLRGINKQNIFENDEDKEGKLIGLEPNRVLRDDNGKAVDIIFGTFIITGLTEDDFGSLTDEQAEYYLDIFRCPEIILRTGNGFVALKIEE